MLESSKFLKAKGGHLKFTLADYKLIASYLSEFAEIKCSEQRLICSEVESICYRIETLEDEAEHRQDVLNASKPKF